jgi:hypothetical protein
VFRLIKHTERFVEDEEGLCIQVLQHLRNMVERETRFGRKVGFEDFISWRDYYVNMIGSSRILV